MLLAEPVLTFARFDAFVEVAKSDAVDPAAEAMWTVVNTLPPAHR